MSRRREDGTSRRSVSGHPLTIFGGLVTLNVMRSRSALRNSAISWAQPLWP